MSRKTNNQIKMVAAIAVVLFLGASFAPQINQFIVDITGGENPFVPPTTSGLMAPQKFTLYQRGTTTAIETASVYAWYDWNGNGLVDLGAYPDGEIETLSSAATSGLVETGMEYPIGEPILYQIHKAAHEVETFSRTRSTVPAAHDGSALVVPSCFLTLTDTGQTEVHIQGQLLVTTTGTYNYVTGGDEPEVQFTHVSVTGDTGINEQAFTHWGTGKDYVGTFIGVIMTNQDFLDLQLDGYSGFFRGDANTYVWYFVDGYFNDGDTTGDERYSISCFMDISDVGSLASIGVYNGVEAKKMPIGSWNTVIGTIETIISVVDA